MSHTPGVVNSLRYYLNYEMGNSDSLEAGVLYPAFNGEAVEWMTALWCGSWLGVRPEEDQVRDIKRLIAKGSLHHLPWVLGEIYNSLALLLPGTKEQAGWKKEAERLAARYGFRYLQDLVKVRDAWERAFQVLDQLNNAAGTHYRQRHRARDSPDLAGGF